MKRIALSFFTAMLLGALAIPASAANPRGTTTVKIGAATVSVEYGRPALHGKTITEELARLPVGEFWRLGADKSTTFTTSADLHFGDTVVPKGVYSLFARKDANNKWTLVFNKQHGQWGIKGGGRANLDPKLDVAAVPLHESKAMHSANLVTIKLANEAGNGHFSIQWGDMELTTTFTAA
jgi:Protein of unknown function (DUF2911)